MEAEVPLAQNFLVLTPRKSPSDDREYQVCVLENGIKTLFIHDGKAEKSSCSLSMGVGSIEDLSQALGVAHFLEHMLFMGSDKYPLHNEYSSFVAAHAGYDNAYTSDEETNYILEVANPHFKEGVDRLMHFFISPLLTPDCVEKERQAVHEEYKLRTNEDNSRKWELLRCFADGPYRRFSIGNQETLGSPAVRDHLLTFYNRHYSSSQLAAVFLSNMSLAEMRTDFLPLLRQIPQKNCPKTKYGPSFPAGNMHKLIKMQSIKDECLLEFFWIVEDLRPHYKQHPHKYLTHVLGHEGRNSLLDILKELQYASQIVSYSHDLVSQTIIGLEIHLTELGEKHHAKVYNIVADYTDWLQPDPVIYAELQQCSQINFDFLHKKDNLDTVETLASEMHRLPLPEILSHQAVYDPFDVALHAKVMRQLSADNLLLFFSNSDDLTNPLTEKYLGANYKVSDLPARKKSKVIFHPLQANGFLPIDTTIALPANQKQTGEDWSMPLRIDNMYLLQDRQFNTCRGGVKLLVHSNTDRVFRELLAKYLEELLTDISYDASVLKLNMSIDSVNCLSFTVFGFSDTVSKLMQKVGRAVRHIHRGDKAEKLFEICLDNLVEEYENFYCDDINEIVTVSMTNLLLEPNCSIEATLEILQNYHYASFCELIDAFWQQCSFEWIFVGNFNPEHTNKLVQDFQQPFLPLNPLTLQLKRCLRVTETVKQVIQLSNKDISTSGCQVYFDYGQYTELNYCKLTLLRDFIKEPFFDELRTQKQLAYYLHSYVQKTSSVLGMLFVLVSSTKDPEYISNEIKVFVRKFFAEAKLSLTQQRFQQLKGSLRVKLLTPHNNVEGLFQEVCQEVSVRTYYFNRKTPQEVDKYLSLITREHLFEIIDLIFEHSLEVLVVAQPHAQEFLQKTVTNVRAFQTIKADCSYHPDADKLQQP